jgi:hypothetical protein
MAKCRVNGTTARMTKPILIIHTMAVSEADHEILKGTVMPRPQKRRRFGITHYTFCSTSSQEESHGDS